MCAIEIPVLCKNKMVFFFLSDLVISLLQRESFDLYRVYGENNEHAQKLLYELGDDQAMKAFFVVSISELSCVCVCVCACARVFSLQITSLVPPSTSEAQLHMVKDTHTQMHRLSPSLPPSLLSLSPSIPPLSLPLSLHPSSLSLPLSLHPSSLSLPMRGVLSIQDCVCVCNW